MSEATPEATATEAEVTNAAEQPTAEPEGLGDAGKKALQAERDARKEAEKRAADAERRVREFEDSQKTQAEKDAEARAELERTSAANAAKALRYEVAEKAGLPLSAAVRLQGATEADLLKDAEALKELLGGTTETRPVPKPDKSQGATGGKPAPKTLNDAISAHYSES